MTAALIGFVAFAARSFGVPFFDLRGLREWTRRETS
jgi:hypothetical protein